MLRITGMVLFCLFFAFPVQARQHHHKHHRHHDHHTHHWRHRKHSTATPQMPAVTKNGVVRSVSGAVAHVTSAATGAFQCIVTALDAQGYPIRFMGGWRAHGSVRGSLHPAGLALDINQIRRNVTRPQMPSNEIALANSCGLISGAQWAYGDSGHFQLGGWAGGRKHTVRNYRHYEHHLTRVHARSIARYVIVSPRA